MKKFILPAISIISISAFASYNVIVSKSQNDYNVVLGYSENVVVGNWTDVGSPSCEYDIEENDLYYGRIANQTKTCSQEQTRATTTTKTYTDGRTEENVKHETKFTDTVTTIDITGTHLEISCNGILNNNYSTGNGTYPINPTGSVINAYCDMTSDDGGWTRVIHNKAPLASDHKNIINALFGNGQDKLIRLQSPLTTIYYKRHTTYNRDFYENMLTTWRNLDNALNVDFTMNHSYSGIMSNSNNFSFCNFSNEPDPEHTYVGFPRDCGQTTNVGGRWILTDHDRSSIQSFTSNNHAYDLWIK